MYLLALQQQYWYDSVFFYTEKWFRAGDILQDANNIYLCLWDTIAYPELYKPTKDPLQTPVVLSKKFLSKDTLDIITRMVQEYYSSYKAVVNLFLPWTDSFLQKHTQFIKKNKQQKDVKQEVFIFPTLWHITQYLEKNKQSIKDTAILHGWLTVIQKQHLFFSVQQGTIQQLFATNRGLFFDRYNLEAVHIFDPSNWAFSSKSEPRFVLLQTAEKVADHYKAKVIIQ